MTVDGFGVPAWYLKSMALLGFFAITVALSLRNRGRTRLFSWMLRTVDLVLIAACVFTIIKYRLLLPWPDTEGKWRVLDAALWMIVAAVAFAAAHGEGDDDPPARKRRARRPLRLPSRRKQSLEPAT